MYTFVSNDKLSTIQQRCLYILYDMNSLPKAIFTHHIWDSQIGIAVKVMLQEG